MSRHDDSHGHQRPHGADGGEAPLRPRTRRHGGTRNDNAHDDRWRKHPLKSLDAELALLPLWRRKLGAR